MTSYNKENIENTKTTSQMPRWMHSLFLTLMGGGAAYVATAFFF